MSFHVISTGKQKAVSHNPRSIRKIQHFTKIRQTI